MRRRTRYAIYFISTEFIFLIGAAFYWIADDYTLLQILGWEDAHGNWWAPVEFALFALLIVPVLSIGFVFARDKREWLKVCLTAPLVVWTVGLIYLCGAYAYWRINVY